MPWPLNVVLHEWRNDTTAVSAIASVKL